MLGIPKILGWSLSAGFIVLLLAVVALSYFTINNAISFTHLEDSLTSTSRSRDALIRIVELDWKGISKDELRVKLEIALNDESVPVQLIKSDEQRNSIWFGEIEFRFEGDRLTAVR